VKQAKYTLTGSKDYLVVQQLLGYDYADRPQYELKCIRLPKRITQKTLLSVLNRLSQSYIEAVAMVKAKSAADAKDVSQYFFIADESEVTEPCQN